MNPNYFEAILQLRNPSPEATMFIDKRLNTSVSQIKKVRNGLDFYVKDKKRAEIVARAARTEFGGDFNIAASLHTQDKQTSKGLYRLNILLRLPNFQKGDVILVGKDLVRISSMGKTVQGKTLAFRKKKFLKYDDFEVIPRHETRVIKVEPHVEVMHPESYQPEPLQNEPEKELRINEKVKVVLHKGVWIV